MTTEKRYLFGLIKCHSTGYIASTCIAGFCVYRRMYNTKSLFGFVWGKEWL